MKQYAIYVPTTTTWWNNVRVVYSYAMERRGCSFYSDGGIHISPHVLSYRNILLEVSSERQHYHRVPDMRRSTNLHEQASKSVAVRRSVPITRGVDLAVERVSCQIYRRPLRPSLSLFLFYPLFFACTARKRYVST